MTLTQQTRLRERASERKSLTPPANCLIQERARESLNNRFLPPMGASIERQAGAFSRMSRVELDVHHAARIMSAGHGGQVLLSQATSALVAQVLPDGVQMQDLGEHRLKDLRRPSRLFQLVIAGLLSAFPPLHTLDSSPNNLP